MVQGLSAGWAQRPKDIVVFPGATRRSQMLVDMFVKCKQVRHESLKTPASPPSHTSQALVKH